MLATRNSGPRRSRRAAASAAGTAQAAGSATAGSSAAAAALNGCQRTPALTSTASVSALR